MTVDTSDFRNGMGLVVDNQVYQLIEFQHVKPGKGGAFVRMKMKNLRTAGVLEKTVRAGEKFQRAHLERKPLQYLYSTGNDYFFMDMESYEQISIDASAIGSTAKYLKDGTEVGVLFYEGRVLNVDLPINMELRVVETDPGVRGDTASGGSKPATVESGAVIQVPLFVNVDDVIKVDTRTDEYLGRVKS